MKKSHVRKSPPYLLFGLRPLISGNLAGTVPRNTCLESCFILITSRNAPLRGAALDVCLASSPESPSPVFPSPPSSQSLPPFLPPRTGPAAKNTSGTLGKYLGPQNKKAKRFDRGRVRTLELSDRAPGLLATALSKSRHVNAPLHKRTR